MYANMPCLANALVSWKRKSDLTELELHMAVSLQMWVLETKCGSFGRTESDAKGVMLNPS